jgi:hypothetical protein
VSSGPFVKYEFTFFRFVNSTKKEVRECRATTFLKKNFNTYSLHLCPKIGLPLK